MPRESDDAPAMNCRDAREGLPTFVRGGGMGVTDLALVAAHLRECGDCRRERASLEQMVADVRQRTAFTCALRQSFTKRIDAMRPVTAFAARLTRLRVWRSVAATVPGQAAPAGETSLVDLLARRLGRLPELAARAVETSAHAREVTGPLIAWLAGLLVRVRVALIAAHRWAARSASEVAGRGGTLALELLTWVRRTPPVLSTRFSRIAAHVVGTSRSVIPFTRTLRAGRVGAIRMADRLASGLSEFRTRPLLAASAGIAILAVLASTIMSQSVRSPSDRMPAATTATPRPTKTSVVESISSPADPAAPSEPKASRVAIRARRVEAEIPAPLRGGDPSSPATVLAPIPATEAARSAEPSDAPDSSAAIDWLLRGGPRTK